MNLENKLTGLSVSLHENPMVLLVKTTYVRSEAG